MRTIWRPFRTKPNVVGHSRFLDPMSTGTFPWSKDRVLQDAAYSGWWFGTWILFFHILGIVTPTDELIFFQRGRSTTNQICVDLPIWTFTWMQISPHNSLLIVCLVGFECFWLKLVFVPVNLPHMPLCFKLYWQQSDDLMGSLMNGDFVGKYNELSENWLYLKDFAPGFCSFLFRHAYV